MIDITGVSVPQLTEDRFTWKGASLLSVQQMTSGGLQLLLEESARLATAVRSDGVVGGSCSNKLVATVFYEASTRTSCSFQAAALRLGAKYIHVDSSSSSTKKGETLSDTIRCLACYVDGIILVRSLETCVSRLVGVELTHAMVLLVHSPVTHVASSKSRQRWSSRCNSRTHSPHL